MLTKNDAPTTLLQVMGAVLYLFRFPSRLIHLILQCRDSLLEPLGHRCAHGSHILHDAARLGEDVPEHHQGTEEHSIRKGKGHAGQIGEDTGHHHGGDAPGLVPEAFMIRTVSFPCRWISAKTRTLPDCTKCSGPEGNRRLNWKPVRSPRRTTTAGVITTQSTTTARSAPRCRQRALSDPLTYRPRERPFVV